MIRIFNDCSAIGASLWSREQGESDVLKARGLGRPFASRHCGDSPDHKQVRKTDLPSPASAGGGGPL